MTRSVAAFRSTGATTWQSMRTCSLAPIYAELGQFDEAWRWIGDVVIALETTEERSYCFGGRSSVLIE
jgi:hypothetical protein